ncbi:MAG: hypothetical protein ACI8T1_001355 [Verrucomicrobiales bacterium]|jgi:hypothetical protein
MKYLSLALLFLSNITLARVAIVQGNGDYVAFQAELGKLNDWANDGIKFDLMGPDQNSLVREYSSSRAYSWR